jgi:class 3 adenylate cyclase
MQPLGVKRRLTCILAADAVGYSRMMGDDEAGTLRVLAAHRAVIDGIIAFYEGRIIGTAGDSVLAEFGSAVEAVRCAVEIQEALKTRNESLPEEHRLQFRVGVNLGDVVVKGEDLLGDGVNVAARLESIAEPGGVCIASSVYDQITGKLDLGFIDIGEQSLKNISRPIRVYRVAAPGGPLRTAPARGSTPGKGFARSGVAAVAAVLVAALAIAWQTGWLNVGAPRGSAEQGKSQIVAEGAQRQSTTAGEQTQQQARNAADDVKRHADVEAELTRARAVAEAEAVRARAEAEAARTKAEADALLAKSAAAAAATRARSETESVRSAAEADKARSDQARREAEAKLVEATARPVASGQGGAAATAPSAAPANSAPNSAVAGTPVRAGPYDGAWMIGRACEAFEELPTLSDQWRVTVQGGGFDIERGGRGQPGYWHISGNPANDGTLVLAGVGISRNQKHVGRQVQARFEGRLIDDRFVLKGSFGGRACTLTLARAGG